MMSKTLRLKRIGIILCSLALGLIIASVSSHATEKDAASISLLEKKMLADNTKKIQYRKGKIQSVTDRTWKKAKKIKKTADRLTIRKKGWYTLCVTTKSGKRKLTPVYFRKKTYDIPINRALGVSAGYYYVVPRENPDSAIEVRNASLAKGAAVSVWTRGDCACRVWKLEPAGGGKFRFQNANSGLYLTCMKKKGDYVVVQKAYVSKSKEQLFRLYEAGAGQTYIKCIGTKKYLQTEGNDLKFTDRKKKKAWKFKWEKTECPPSFAVITDATYPTELAEGTAFTLQGTINSRYTMTVLSAGVYDKAGKTILQKKTTPNSCFADLKAVDAAITFGKLPAGIYTYKVVVRDVAGKDITLINRGFTVGVVLNPGSKMLSYNTDLIDQIGHQSTGTALEKKACASYALAYCNAILTGTVTSPHSYWSSATNVDCVWSRGGYTTKAYSSEQLVLQAVYAQLAAGKPCILHVTGTTEQHWLAVVGCKKSTASPILTTADFVAIDPWDGRLITISDKYKVKSTFRLGVKS